MELPTCIASVSIASDDTHLAQSLGCAQDKFLRACGADRPAEPAPTLDLREPSRPTRALCEACFTREMREMPVLSVLILM